MNEKRTVRGPGGGSRDDRQVTRYRKCDVRLNPYEDRTLDKLARKYGVSRSDVMRRALRDFSKFMEEWEE